MSGIVAPPVEPAADLPATDPGEPLRIAGWSLGVPGLLAVLLSIGPGSISVDHRNRYQAYVDDATCPPLQSDGSVPPTAPERCHLTAGDWRQNETLAYAIGIPGGVLLLTGLTLLIIGYALPAPQSAPSEVAPGDGGPGSAAERAARDVARGIAFESAAATTRLSIRCGAFADLGVSCLGGF